MRVLLLEPNKFPSAAIDLLRSHGLKVFDDESICDTSAEILFVRLAKNINKTFINQYPNLKYIVSPTTGLNHIDVEYAFQKEISIVSFNDDKKIIEEIRSTTELGIGNLIALMRKIPQAYESVRSGYWDRLPYSGSDINNKKVLVIGFGRLGKQIAKVYDVFGAKVSVFDKPNFAISEFPVVKNLINEIGKFDIISVHLSLDADSTNLLSKEILSNINKTAVLLNTSRGEVLDQKYLFEMIKTNRLAGIALDVVSDEFSDDSRSAINDLLMHSSDKVVITPHIGGYTKESLEFVEMEVTKKLLISMGLF
jgi:D-3-phosphoglycerate dehydrogenase / 2-oxoglutarate reductase